MTCGPQTTVPLSPHFSLTFPEACACATLPGRNKQVIAVAPLIASSPCTTVVEQLSSGQILASPVSAATARSPPSHRAVTRDYFFPHTVNSIKGLQGTFKSVPSALARLLAYKWRREFAYSLSCRCRDFPMYCPPLAVLSSRSAPFAGAEVSL
jgi:hypothetical protein